MPLTLILAVALSVGTSIFLLGRFFGVPQDRLEPALVQSTIPVVGHVINLLRNGTDYYSQVAKRCGKPIFTLGLPRAKMYVVTTPSLVAACDKRARTVSFAPYVVAFAERIMSASRASIDLLSENLFEDEGPSLRLETIKSMHESLKGDDLSRTLQMSLKAMITFLDSEENTLHPNGASLFQWTRRFLSTTSTQALYGSGNPMRESSVMDDFWMVDRDFGLLGLNIVPGLLAPRANRARTRFFRAFRQYYSSGGPERASRFIKARYEVNKKYEIPDEEIARFDLGVCTALLVNTVPAMAWILYHAFSDPAVLAQLRAGIERIVFGKSVITSSSATVVSIPEIIKGFPFLEAFVMEVLRTQSHGSATRRVLQDTLIDDADGTTYLLKKDSILTMPSDLVHGNTAGWGADAGKFDPTRFLGAQNIKIAASSYRVFGGGNAICPGKQFAMNSVESVLLIMVLRFDLEPLYGTWEKPIPKEHIATSFLMPTEDIMVKIKPRKLDTDFEFVWEST